VPPAKLKEDTADDLPVETRVDEGLSAAGALRVPPPKPHVKPFSSDPRHPDDTVPRPALLDAIIEAEHGEGWKNKANQDVVSEADIDGDVPFFVDGKPAQLSRGRRHSKVNIIDEDEEDTLGFGEDIDWNELGVDGPDPHDEFSLQFQQVVPDRELDNIPDDALVKADPRHHADKDALEISIPSSRWWGRTWRTFFRHDYRAYRVVDGQWKLVPDPRGPRYRPRKRFGGRRSKREAKIKQQMLAGRVRA